MNFADRIYYQAVRGTQNNKGLPPALASLLVAQAKHETGDFSSNLFTKFNNAFGYTYTPASIYQTGAGTLADNNAPIGAYRNIEDSTKEIVDWIYRRVKDGKFPADLSSITTPDQYAALLKNANYFTDSLANYAAGLRRWFIQVLNVVRDSGSSFYLILAAGAIMYFYFRRKR